MPDKGFHPLQFQEINEVGFFLLLLEPASALVVCVEYMASFQDRKHFLTLFWKNGCLKRLGFNKDGEKDVGPSAHILFVLTLHLHKELGSHACPKKNQPINKQQ